MKIHLISHVHWDREWHKTFEEYRVSLVYFMDDLIETLENDEKYNYFLLDGQSIVLDDYLSIKPENAERLNKLIEINKLIVGPWYIQPDEFVPSGEMHIRNIMIGTEIAKKFGKSMHVGYLPDSFGQDMNMPQIFKSFGFKNHLFWRGLGSSNCKEVNFKYISPDGSSVVSTNLRTGYGNGHKLSLDLESNIKILENEIQSIATDENDLLIMCGFDQSFINKDLVQITEQLTNSEWAKENKHEIVISRLEDYFENIKTRKLNSIEGDLRFPENERIHLTIAATRLDIKKLNYECQNLLIKQMEPLLTIANTYGMVYPVELVKQAFKYTISNHAHDSICSCSTDDTHEEMIVRYKKSMQIANSLILRAKEFMNNVLKVSQDSFVVYNLSAFNGVQNHKISVKTNNSTFKIFDSKGNEVEYCVDSCVKVDSNDTRIEIGKKNESVIQYDTKLVINYKFEGIGFEVFNIKSAENNNCANYLYNEDKDEINTENYFAFFNDDNSLTMKNKNTNEVVEKLNVFLERGNAGDEYDYSPPYSDEIISKPKLSTRKCIVNTALTCKIETKQTYLFPVDTMLHSRSDEYKECEITSVLTFYRDLHKVDFEVKFDNNVKNHQIHAVFPSNGFKYHYRDSHYGNVRQENMLSNIDQSGWSENYYEVYPVQKYFSIPFKQSCLTVQNKGIPLYEYKNGEFYMPLISTTDFMGKQDLKNRPGRRSGLHTYTEKSLMLGEFTTEFSVMFTKLTNTYGQLEDNIMVSCSNTNIETNGITSLNLLKTSALINLECFKPAVDGNGYIVRVSNKTNEPLINEKIYINLKNIQKFSITNSYEDNINDAEEIQGNIIQFDKIAQNEFITLKLI